MCAKKKKGTAVKVLLIILCVLLALILAVAVLVAAYMSRLSGMVNRVDGTVATLAPEVIASIEKETDPIEPDFTGEVLDPTEITWSTLPPETVPKEDHIINILLIGQDRRPGQGRQRSDSMILCTVNKKTGHLTMTSFLRDLYVQIPGYQDNRLNVAYVFGGMPLLNEALWVNFGVQVDGNIEVDFSGFERIVDAMGGVDVEMTAAEVKWLSNHNWGLKTGVNHLNGEQALTFARIRKLDSDFGRTDRQRAVLTAMLKQMRNCSLEELMKVVETAMGIVTTDMEDAEILGLVVELFPLLKDIQIDTQHIPAEGTYRGVYVRGMAVLVPDLDANRELLNQTIMQ